MASISQIKVGTESHPLTTLFLTVPSSVAAGTQAKTADLTGFTADDLVAGLMIKLKLTNGNSHATPTLSINSTTAKTITGDGMCKPASFTTTGSIMNLTYDGTNWVIT